MPITSLNGLINALANTSGRFVIDKASIANAAVGQFFSLWRATGVPGQANIPPSTPENCTAATPGAIQFSNVVAPVRSYLGWLSLLCANAGANVEIHDRLVQVGGLSGILTTSQVVGIDLSTRLTQNNLAERIGNTNYSDVQWWVEWYADTGATAITSVVNVTYDDSSTGNLNVAWSATRRASSLISLNALAPTGRFIRAINNVTNPTTGTAGNFGFTATRLRAVTVSNVASRSEIFDWQALGLPDLPNDSCLSLIQIASATTTGVVRGSGKIAQG